MTKETKATKKFHNLAANLSENMISYNKNCMDKLLNYFKSQSNYMK